MKPTPSILHDEIAQRAHDIWEQAGRPEGKETEHWLRAERELRQEREQASLISGPEPTGFRRGEKRWGEARSYG